MQIRSPYDPKIENETKKLGLAYLKLSDEEKEKTPVWKYAQEHASQYYKDYMNKYYDLSFKLNGIPKY